MPQRDDYPPGTPSWVDLTTPDLDGALRFYGALFGWEFEDAGEEAGHYAPVQDPQGAGFCLIQPANPSP